MELTRTHRYTVATRQTHNSHYFEYSGRWQNMSPWVFYGNKFPLFKKYGFYLSGAFGH